MTLFKFNRNSADAARHARTVAWVEQMLALHQRRTVVRTPHEQGVIDAQIAATERQFQSFILPGV